MHASDHTGPGSSAGAGTGTGGGAVTRYIITRPCLAEGSLRLLKYLQPLFPVEGQVTLQDGKGERFTANVELARGRLTGVGELYRAHNMGVNDVLLLSRAEEGHYRVECVVKPHARPQTGPAERPAPAPLTTEKRVVIHATPHVREVRVERVPAEPLKAGGRPREVADASANSASAQQKGGGAFVSGEREAAAQRNTAQISAVQISSVQISSVQANEAQFSSVQPVRIQTVQPQPSPVTESPVLGSPAAGVPAAGVPTTEPTAPQHRRTPVDAPSARGSTPIIALTAQMHAASPVRGPSSHALPIQISFPAPGVRPATLPAAAVRPVTGGAAQVAAPKPTAVPHPATPADLTTALATGRAETGHTEAGHTETGLTTTGETAGAEGSRAAEDQLAALARLTGYTCDHLGSGVVRLRADLGSHSYSVLIATTPQALTTPAWRESCDYMALLTAEHERPHGIPRFTHAALEALLEHARAATLSPVDLRGYWNTGSFDHESASSVAELVRAQLTQRQNFSHVLETLAQQPAHSLVHLPRLAERLGGGLNTAELHSILETLSRAPFLALTPLPNGQYYLRSEVRDLVQEFGAYAESMQRRLRPAHAARA